MTDYSDYDKSATEQKTQVQCEKCQGYKWSTKDDKCMSINKHPRLDGKKYGNSIDDHRKYCKTKNKVFDGTYRAWGEPFSDSMCRPRKENLHKEGRYVLSHPPDNNKENQKKCKDIEKIYWSHNNRSKLGDDFKSENDCFTAEEIKERTLKIRPPKVGVRKEQEVSTGCGAKTKKGSLCKNKITGNNKYCHVHNK